MKRLEIPFSNRSCSKKKTIFLFPHIFDILWVKDLFDFYY